MLIKVQRLLQTDVFVLSVRRIMWYFPVYEAVVRLITTHVDAAVDARAPLRRPPPCSSVIPPSLAATAILPPLQILRRGLEIGHAQEKGRGHQRPQDGVLHLLTLLQPRSATSPNGADRRDCFSEPSPTTHYNPQTGCTAASAGDTGRGRAREGGRRKSRSVRRRPPRLDRSQSRRAVYVSLSAGRVGRRTATTATGCRL